MKIVINESTRRGVLTIKDTVHALCNAGHQVLLIAMAHPDTDLKYGSPPFMVGENAYMLDGMDCDISVMPKYSMSDIYQICRDYGAQIYITKGDNRMPRDDMMCRVLRSMIPDIHIVGLQADIHMYINPGWHSEEFMVSGQYWKDYLISVGVHSDNITVVGSIKADYVRNNYSKRYPEYIVFYDQMMYSNDQRKMIVEQLEALSHIVSKSYLIKLHPAWKEYRVGLDDIWPGVSNRYIVDECDPYYLLEIAVLAITGFSSTGYEGVSLDVPVLILSVAGDITLYRGCGVEVDSIDQLASRGLDIIDGKYDKEGLMNWMLDHYYSDGRSPNRIVSKLEYLADEWGI